VLINLVDLGDRLDLTNQFRSFELVIFEDEEDFLARHIAAVA
jgi:hypothetical protein